MTTNKTKTTKKVKITEPLVEEVIEINAESVERICKEYLEKYDLINVLQLTSWKIKFKIEDNSDDAEACYLGLCEYDNAYSLSDITIFVKGHETPDDVKDTLMHELVHIVLSEIDHSARNLSQIAADQVQSYVLENLHIARERSVITVSNILRSIYK